MCVDDYQFRHSSARREKHCRRFIFTNDEGNERVFLVNISQFELHDDLCLCEILLHLSKKGLNIKDYEFQLPQFNIFIQAGDRCRVPFDIFNKKDIPIHMHKIIQNHDYPGQLPEKILSSDEEDCEEISSEDDRMSSQFSPDQSRNMVEEPETVPRIKKTRKRVVRTKQHEKTIREAVEKTKYWRQLHQKMNLSLKNAAIYVGLSKKTLDDYFLVIRVGELHGYDFKSNMDKKIGHLRSYIKSQPLKIRGRLSKMVECFKFVADPLWGDIQMPTASQEKLIQIKEEVILPQQQQVSRTHLFLPPTYQLN